MLSPMNTIKILAVDDDVFNLDIMSEYLTLAGFEVVAADDGDIALRKLEDNPDIAVIILDRMMPRMGGMEVLRRVKTDPRFCNVPVLMQTAVTSPGRKFEAINAGVFRYLTKPYEDMVLISQVREAVVECNKKA